MLALTPDMTVVENINACSLVGAAKLRDALTMLGLIVRSVMLPEVMR